MTIRLDVATASDCPALCDLLDVLFTQEIEFKPDREAQTRGLTAVISDDGIGRIFVARLENRVVGMVMLLFTVSTALGERAALLEDMVVSPGCRGRGIGSKLLRHAVAFAETAGCKRITLLTDSENIEGQAFYRKHGFAGSSMVPMRLHL